MRADSVMEETAQLTAQATHEWGKLLFLGKDGQPAEHYTISKNTVVLGRLVSALSSTCTARTLVQSGSQHLQNHWMAVPSKTSQLPLKRPPIAVVLWEFEVSHGCRLTGTTSRDKSCDIVIPRREVSRQHARLAVDDSGAVWLSSMGKEPVCVNGQPAHEAVELYTGDQIEVRHLHLICRHALMASDQPLLCQCSHIGNQCSAHVGASQVQTFFVVLGKAWFGIPGLGSV